MTIRCECGAETVVAGAYPRRSGTRPQTGGRVPSEGRYDWGRHPCHACGKVNVIPELSEQEQGVVG